MKEILKTKEAQILVVDHDEAEEVESSEEKDYNEDDFASSYGSVSANRPTSSQQRHKVDLRLKRKPGAAVAASHEESQRPPSKPTKPERNRSSGDPGAYRHQSRRGSDNLNDSWDSNDSNDNDEVKSRLSSNRHEMLAAGKQAERNGSISSLVSATRPGSSHRQVPTPSSHLQNGDGLVASPDSPSLLSYSSTEHARRPGSRGSTAGELGPLRAPSPTSAQIINSLRSRQQVQSPPTSPRRRKLR